jgi:D-arabinose 1-dehydrogenase-like Zn-dependent alcohol dehydrogenase
MNVSSLNLPDHAAPQKSIVSNVPVRTYAALGAGQALQPWGYEPCSLERHDIELAITHCGLCHGDLHLIDNDLGLSNYPLVPGHEIVGRVTAVGNHIKGLAAHRVATLVISPRVRCVPTCSPHLQDSKRR